MRVAKRSCLLFLPAAIVLLAGMGGIYFYETDSAINLLKLHNRDELEQCREIVKRDFQRVVDDLMVYRQKRELSQIFSGEKSATEELANELKTLCTVKRIYDQARVLDTTGQEIIRVNYRQGKATIVAKKDLQAKGARDYFKQAFALPNGRVYVSEFDLNQEQGRFEKPFKSVIRFATPLYDPFGNKRGVLVLNVRGRYFLDRFRDAKWHADSTMMLLNQAGYWLRGAPPEKRWGHILPDRKGFSFRQDFKAAWKGISRTPRGQLQISGGIFSHDIICPRCVADALAASSTSGGDFQHDAKTHTPTVWRLVNRVNEKSLTAVREAWFSKLAVLFSLGIATLGVGAWIIAHLTIRRELELAAGMTDTAAGDRSARYYLIVASGAIFLAEIVVMLVLRALGDLPFSAEIIVDPLVLIVTVSPVLYLFLFHPLLRQIEARRQSERALRKNEMNLHVTLQSIGDAVIATDAAGRVTRMNSVAEQLTGWTLDEARGKPLPEVFQIINEQTRETVENPVDKVIREGSIVDLANHTLLIAKDGCELPIADSGAPIRVSDDSEILGVVLVFRDQSKEKKAQAALAESEDKFRLLYDSNHDAIMMLTPAHGFISGNPATVKMFGCKDEAEFITKAPPDFSPQYQPDGRSSADKALEMMTVALEEGSHFFEWIYTRLDGTEFPVTVLLTKMTLGREVILQATVRDTTKQRAAEAELRRLSAAIEHSAEAVVVTDTSGNIQYANPAFEVITGHALADVVGQNMRILKSGKHNRAFYQEFLATIKGGKTWRGEMVNRRKNGELYDEESAVSPVFNAVGEIVNFVATKRDVTAERQLEAQFQQAQKMEVVGRLAGGFAHDFNNLLVGILGYAELLQNTVREKPTELRYTEQILTAANRAGELTRQLLSFARKDAAEYKPLDLNTVITNALNLLRPSLDRRSEIVQQLSTEPMNILGDSGQLEAAILNLGINANDAMPDGGTLTITSKSVSLDAPYCHAHADELKPGYFAKIIFSDTGTGMDSDTSSRIFEPFFTTKGVGKGTGLGLAGAYSSIRRHDGAIHVYSELDKGTVFTIYLPLIAAANGIDLPTVKPEIISGSGRILVIDDEPVARNLAQDMLTGLGYTVDLCENGQAGIDYFRAHHDAIDMVLLDMNMPGLSGGETFTGLREIAAAVRVVLCSGYDLDETMQDVLDAGALGPIVKPFEYAKFSQRIAAYISGTAE